VVKEETSIAGFPVRLGTACLPSEPALADATIVARLRAAGAIVLGQSPMTEYGMSPLGVNPHRRMPRNPHRADRLAGGSSTGSGVAVAEGICPIAVGADGGGSIRIPACLSGVFGLKPTFGRVSRHGDLFGGSMNHLGPIGASPLDLAVFLEIVGNPDPLDPLTRDAPEIAPGSLVRAVGRGVRGLRIGVLEDELDDAAPEVATSCRAALSALEHDGATLVPLRFEFGRHAAPIGYIIIAVETFSETRAVRLEHFDELGPDFQLLLSIVGALGVSDYADALRLRSGLRAAVANLLRDVDVLALPTTKTGAVKVDDAEMESGFLDPPSIDAVCRYAFLANLTGLPAITCPVGVDRDGMPTGFQIVGDAWDEATVLAVAAHLERLEVAAVKRPHVSFDPLA
jgi:Asp-tRNA(Asn)/Glu-tRNA(Gln) amidotransferase A subunit family amidase